MRTSSLKNKQWNKKRSPYVFFGAIALALFVIGIYAGKNFFTAKLWTKAEMTSVMKKHATADLLNFHDNEMKVDGYEEPVILEYSIDAGIQLQAEEIFEQYHPDFGALVAIDAESGRILASTSTNRAFNFTGIPAFRATIPAASVFKVITAAAAIEENQYHGESIIAYSGRDHTLYRSQVLKPEVRGWKRLSTLKTAFAHSINSVFGRLGVFSIGAEGIQVFADRFWFNRPIPTEFEIEASKIATLRDKWEIAEAASGFTQGTTMSPVHGAMIAAAIANDGRMMEPYFIQSAMLKGGQVLYRPEPKLLSQAISPQTANELRTLMRETVVRGTGRKSFKGFFKGSFHELDVGGKTGSLTGKDPGGKVDWFVGFARAGGRKIGVAVVTVHQKYWTVKSAYIARKTFEKAFQELRTRGPSSKVN